MLAIARGLMARPRVMLLDEPSLGLSPILVGEIFAIIRRLREERGVAMLLVEQNARAALDIADFGYVMETGRVVMDGPAELLKRSRDIQEFLPWRAGPRRARRARRATVEAPEDLAIGGEGTACTSPAHPPESRRRGRTPPLPGPRSTSTAATRW